MNFKGKLFWVVVFNTLLMIAIGFCSCHIHVDDMDTSGTTVIVTNNSNKSFRGTVWTDSQELFNGTIRAWNAKTFRVPDGSNVYTDFESDNGGKSSPSGHVSGYRTLILEL